MRTLNKHYTKHIFRSTTTMVVVIAVMAIGIYLLAIGHAATPYASVLADAGTTASSAEKTTCSGAYDGNCIVFSAATSSILPRLVGKELESGTSGTRLKMDGVAVWGIEDNITVNGNTAVGEYNDRQTVVNTIKAWGGNEIRLRVLACDYTAQTYMSQSTELQEIKDWQTTAQAAGLYVGITWWDADDCGSDSDANWTTNYSEAFPMMSAVISELGPTNPWVFYEPFNEPNNISDSQWLTAMEATDHLFRSDDYDGILLIDTNDWSHEYNPSLMTSLQNYDSSQAGMSIGSQIIFAKHDYADEYSDPSTFSESDWEANDDGTSVWNTSLYPVWETEFGNYNCINATCSGAENLSWANEAATAMASYVNNGTLVGATAFVFNWVDANTMTTDDYTTPTQWGGYVENNFLGAVE
jgi:hypothetical protein